MSQHKPTKDLYLRLSHSSELFSEWIKNRDELQQDNEGYVLKI